jgi:fibronectin-binding autotransporter adhesin
MKKFSTRFKLALAAPLFIMVSVAIQFIAPDSASAATLTWTGGGDATTFSDTANWSTGVAPVDGDIITLPGLATTTFTIENDLDISLAGIIIQDVSAGSYTTTNYTVDTLTLQDDATISREQLTGPIRRATLTADFTAEGDLNVQSGPTIPTVTGQFTVAGDLILGTPDGSKRAYPTLQTGSVVTGAIVVNASSSYTIKSTVDAGGYVINNQGTLVYDDSYNPYTFSDPITFNGDISILRVNPPGSCNDGEICETPQTFTFSSNITLNGDAYVIASSGATANFTGSITYNGNVIRTLLAQNGAVQVAGQLLVPAVQVINAGDSQPEVVYYVGTNQTVVINGVRLGAAAYKGGVIKGSGTVDAILTQPGGILSPGNSPGTLTILETFSGYGIYQPEIQSITAYDQIVVGEGMGTTNVVNLNDTTSQLETVLYDGWSINLGEQFMIIDNRSDNPVQGTFAGLAEGAQFTVNDGDVSITFSITYIGGDGNDVVITALNAGNDPTPPNTGALKLVMANPILLAVMGSLTAAILVFLAVRHRATAK